MHGYRLKKTSSSCVKDKGIKAENMSDSKQSNEDNVEDVFSDDTNPKYVLDQVGDKLERRASLLREGLTTGYVAKVVEDKSLIFMKSSVDEAAKTLGDCAIHLKVVQEILKVIQKASTFENYAADSGPGGYAP